MHPTPTHTTASVAVTVLPLLLLSSTVCAPDRYGLEPGFKCGEDHVELLDFMTSLSSSSRPKLRKASV